VAVNTNTGNVAWRRPIGQYPELETLGIRDHGTLILGGTISTAGGVTFVSGTMDRKLIAVESATGKELWSVDLGAVGHNLPLTYLGRDGRQYVSIMVSGGGFLRDPVIPAVIKTYAIPD
jgi:quinoprotein glucose dehydrogenase